MLTGIIFVLRIGTPWELLSPEMGCGAGVTCWRRRRDWHAQGVWDVLHRVLLQRLCSRPANILEDAAQGHALIGDLGGRIVVVLGRAAVAELTVEVLAQGVHVAVGYGQAVLVARRDGGDVAQTGDLRGRGVAAEESPLLVATPSWPEWLLPQTQAKDWLSLSAAGSGDTHGYC